MMVKMKSIFFFLINLRRIKLFKNSAILIFTLYFVFTFITYFYDSATFSFNTHKNSHKEKLILNQMNNSSFALSMLRDKVRNQYQIGEKNISSLTRQRLLELLNEIENESNLVSNKIALIKNWKSVNSVEVEIYKWALQKHGFVVQMENKYSTTKSWYFLVCLNYNDINKRPCLAEHDLVSLKLYQKVNQIFSFKGILGNKFELCSVFNKIRKARILLKQPLSPLCFNFPQQYQQFIVISEALGSSIEWIVSSFSSREDRKIINVFNDQDFKKFKSFSYESGLAQQKITNPLLIFGSSIKLQVFILITSLNPLRAYFHQEGFMHTLTDHYQNYQQINGEILTLNNFWNYISKNFDSSVTLNLKIKIKKVLTQFLLIIEALVLKNNLLIKNKSSESSSNYVQLVSIDLLLNSTFDPWIIDVSLKFLDQLVYKKNFISVKIMKRILDDFLKIVFSQVRVSKNLSDTLEKVLEQNKIGIYDVNCHIFHQMCLSRDDLKYLLNSKREFENLGKFVKLYPSLENDHFDLIQDLNKKVVTDLIQKTFIYKTQYIHKLLMKIEKIYRRNEVNETYSRDNILLKTKQFQIGQCSQNLSTLPFISSLSFEPNLKFYPFFSPYVTKYYANVSYDQVSITIYSLSKNCQTEVRMEHKFGQTRSMVHSLGIGLNKINLLVVDIFKSEPLVINVYTIFIERSSLLKLNSNFDPLSSYMICSLKQDCDLQIYPKEKCGLQQVFTSEKWSNIILNQSLKQECKNEELYGHWLVPCYDCNNYKACFWNKAIWNPVSCRYSSVPKEKLLQCLKNRKILFIGDSTNRGIMHYLIEKMNGTLTDGNKSHGLNIYQNLNQGKTLIAFNYYPKFWLSSSSKLSFDKSLVELIEKVQPLENNSNTVIIFGGVQWLASQHISLLINTLSNFKLEGAKLIMKSLGAGFHQFIEEKASLTLDDERKLSAHNSRIISFANKNGIQVIDTFNLTTSRFKDFYPGKCACHFHLIKPSSKPAKNISQQNYHVEGVINAAISEILINRLCI